MNQVNLTVPGSSGQKKLPFSRLDGEPTRWTRTGSHSPVLPAGSMLHSCISSWRPGVGWSLVPRDDDNATALECLLCTASSASRLVATVDLAWV